MRLAYAGELAAARAYAGQWRSVRDSGRRERIRRIMGEELAHRARVGEMLAELGARPGRLRDFCMGTLGAIIGASCFVGGSYVPMVGAGRIERRNIQEYEDAARCAARAGLLGHADEFLAMAETEWDHERFFHDQVRAHWLHGVVGGWADPPPREEIRRSFLREHPPAHPLDPEEGKWPWALEAVCPRPFQQSP